MEVISQLVLFRYEPKLILMLLCDDESAKKEKKKLMMMNDLVGRYFLHGKKDFLQDILHYGKKKHIYRYLCLHDFLPKKRIGSDV